MSRLIDADTLRKDVEKDRDASDMPKIWYHGVEYAINHIIHAPTVDAVEVVRCKDCAYWGTKVVYANGERADCLNFNFVTPCDFFCKWGERREDGEID